uniref:DUF8040 domain-containing protein n=1 Tax=Rhizophora mucronata TaxID=61149 RepID=A0A2P2PIG9_RHIMU
MFRMDKETSIQLCTILQLNHGLKPSRRMSSIGKVCMLLYTLFSVESVRSMGKHFQHSRETISRCFIEILSVDYHSQKMLPNCMILILEISHYRFFMIVDMCHILRHFLF